MLFHLHGSLFEVGVLVAMVALGVRMVFMVAAILAMSVCDLAWVVLAE